MVRRTGPIVLRKRRVGWLPGSLQRERLEFSRGYTLLDVFAIAASNKFFLNTPNSIFNFAEQLLAESNARQPGVEDE